MSVNTSDEYLDELLHAIEPIIYKDEPVIAPPIVEEPVSAPVVPDQVVSEAVSMQAEPAAEMPIPEMMTAYTDEVQPIETEAVSLGDFVAPEMPVADEMVIEEEPVVTEVTEDVLLQSLMDEAQSEEQIPLEEVVSTEGIDLSDFVEEAMTEGETTENDAVAEESVSMDDLLAAMVSEEGSEVDVDAMLSAAAEAGMNANDSVAHDNDVKELLKQFTDDEALQDIGDILDRDDNSEAVDESVLVTPDVEVFQLEEESEEDEEDEPVKEKKGLFGFFKKGKKKKSKKKDKESQNPESQNIEVQNIEVQNIGAAPSTEFVEADAGVELLASDAVSELDLLGGSNEIEELDTLDLGSLMELGGEEVLPLDEGELNIDSLLSDGEITDIDQLLSAGSFEELGADELLREGIRDKSDAKSKEQPTGFWGKMLNFLFEEDEDEDGVPEAGVTGITDENKEILGELSKEEKKKRKQEEKERKKKAKEAKKNGTAESDDDDVDEEKEKEKKKKKVKKPKPRAVVDLDAKPEKVLSKKKIIRVFFLFFSILVVILLFESVVMGLQNLKDARWAFDNEDYETSYLNLYGEDLSEEDEEIFQKSYIILCVQRKLDSYENFVQLGMDVEALNALFDGIRMYRNLSGRAEELGILDRITEIYQNIYAKLEGYGLSSEEIEEILSYESKVTYTKRLEAIVNGTPFEVETVVPEISEELVAPGPLLDVLPQEEDFLPEDTSNIRMEDNAVSTTTVVGSSAAEESPVASDNSNAGENVGSGNTNASGTVNGDSVVVF